MEFADSVKFAPHVVLFMLGTNDSKERHWLGAAAFREKLLSLLNSYSDLPTKPVIFIAAPPPALPLPTDKNARKLHPSMLGGINASIIAEDIKKVLMEFVVSSEGAAMNVVPHLIDVFSVFSDVKDIAFANSAVESGEASTKILAFKRVRRWLHDGVHPSIAGHQLIAKTFCRSTCPEAEC